MARARTVKAGQLRVTMYSGGDIGQAEAAVNAWLQLDVENKYNVVKTDILVVPRCSSIIIAVWYTKDEPPPATSTRNLGPGATRNPGPGL